MAVEVQQVNDRQILVNEKLIEKDSSDSWIAKIELTQLETEALHKHLTQIN